VIGMEMTPQKTSTACAKLATTKNYNGSTEQERLPPVVPAPDGECGIDDKDHQQKRARTEGSASTDLPHPARSRRTRQETVCDAENLFRGS